MMLRSRLVVAFVIAACHRRESAIADPHDGAGIVSVIASAPVVPHDAGPTPHMIWRVLGRHYFEDEAGVPRDIWIEVQLEVAGKVFGPWKFVAPACTLGASEDKRSVAQLSCYYAGGGDYIDVRRKKPGQYAVVRYAQDEGYADEPSKPENVTTIGTFETNDALDDAIVTADGGAYSPWTP